MTITGNATDLSCDGGNKTHAFLLSKLCTNGSYDESVCIPQLDEQRPYRIGLGVWALVVMAFGVFGNVFTLLAIPYAAGRQR